MKFIGAAIVALVAMPAFAQVVDTGDFSVRALVGVDNTPPTTPTLLSATPIASTQIDVAWSTSTDDFFLSGYVLSRDGTPIATTTLTTFSDTGLTASTTYAYSVQAFDSALNFSSSSNSIATSTPDTPPPPVVATSTDNNISTFVGPRLETFSLETTVNTASFLVGTNRPARIELRWGRTASYELGYISRETFSRTFTSIVRDLEPGTTYEYEIIGYSANNVQYTLRTGRFTTDASESQSPPNVQALRAVVDQTSVILTWQIPRQGVTSVRVVRSHLGFPTSPTDGAIVYQGSANRFVDDDILSRFSPAYYTVFAYGPDGAVSSGAVVVASLSGVADPADSDTMEPIEIDDDVEVFVPGTTIDSERPGETRRPSREEIFIFTDNYRASFATADIVIPKGVTYTVSVPRTAVSGNLKTLLFTLTDPVDTRNTYSYILRLNKGGTAYEATIEPFYVTGWSRFTVVLYDFEARLVARYQKRVWFGEAERGEKEVFFPDYFIERPWIIGAPLAIILLYLVFRLLLALRRREDKHP